MATKELEQSTIDHTAIAEFMEFIKEKNNHYTIKMGGVFTVCAPFAMKFNTDWNWLMPVIDKINSFTEPDNDDAFMFNVTINAALCEIHSTPESKRGFEEIVCNEHGATSIEYVYLAIVDFIKWYNKQKTTEETEKGIYDHPEKYTIKVVGRMKVVNTWCTEMYFTNNPSYGRFQFGIADHKIDSFMEGYELRK